ncbi:GNAT family N-acetyltransferase [Leifsonia shinshuensis]|uniref:GNAT family N-acetyltransferase n=1 Tax=Leifsonia shinshuensis TaxID=150026 RepID=A0A7G6Y640_9MICO|nr:GNAT family N-acetyltransferase [Leifsonia shinshuensis]QNE33955.1 GNAT family N-acetyltransferase [Leifsonia shinshuensis]
MTDWVVRPSVEDDWAAYRAIRLEMLEDTPIAFLETLAGARAHPDEHWRRRAANTSSSGRLFAAVAPDGRWLGTMGGFHATGSPDPHLVGVYVTPSLRGREHGVADALLDSVIAWARLRSGRLLLEVHEHNAAAIRYYERRGFAFTGNTQPYPLDRTARELEMAADL